MAKIGQHLLLSRTNKAMIHITISIDSLLVRWIHLECLRKQRGRFEVCWVKISDQVSALEGRMMVFREISLEGHEEVLGNSAALEASPPPTLRVDSEDMTLHSLGKTFLHHLPTSILLLDTDFLNKHLFLTPVKISTKYKRTKMFNHNGWEEEVASSISTALTKT